MKCPECGEKLKATTWYQVYECPKCARRFDCLCTFTRIPIIKSNAIHSKPIGIYIFKLGINSPVLEIPIYDKVSSFHKYEDLKEELAKSRGMPADEKYLIHTINIIYF